MTFSALAQFIPGDPVGQDRWLLEHYLEHQTFYRELLGQSPTVVTVNLPLQHMRDPRPWLVAHQQVSQSVWTGLGGGQSVDLATVDWNDSAKLRDWLEFHAAWHQSVRDSLSL